MGFLTDFKTQAEWSYVRGEQILFLTTPMRSPRPYSPTSSFLPFALRMTERRRPFRTM